MTTYYRDRDVQVTSAALRVPGQEFRLHELTRVWHSRGRRQWGTVAGRGFLGLAMVAPLVLGALALAVALTLDLSASVTVAVGGGGVLLGLAAIPLSDVLLEHVDRSYDRGSHDLEIWADVRGTPTLLLRTANRQRFGQIYRALHRAVEQDSVRR
ncbi:DUF6232 family protein [Symbioplanes lichenis]|uniref:DUF6232 family protein n=1 Tax=Symbioplanes lichenis TaxID=1629072 RepID=UPI002738C827|nr:DUF6232 family protein [Actinoplanes lichenis]